jgi:hypothetical protein
VQRSDRRSSSSSRAVPFGSRRPRGLHLQFLEDGPGLDGSCRVPPHRRGPRARAWAAGVRVVRRRSGGAVPESRFWSMAFRRTNPGISASSSADRRSWYHSSSHGSAVSSRSSCSRASGLRVQRAVVLKGQSVPARRKSGPQAPDPAS